MKNENKDSLPQVLGGCLGMILTLFISLWLAGVVIHYGWNNIITTKPDTDNLQKLLKDCMTKLGYWQDDAQVASEIVEKFWADTVGIYIKIEELP